MKILKIINNSEKNENSGLQIFLKDEQNNIIDNIIIEKEKVINPNLGEFGTKEELINYLENLEKNDKKQYFYELKRIFNK